MSSAAFWKHKLAAYLHDIPNEALDIRMHGLHSDLAFRQAGITDPVVGRYFDQADHTGTAANWTYWP